VTPTTRGRTAGAGSLTCPCSVDHAAAASADGCVLRGRRLLLRRRRCAAFVFDGRSWRRLPNPPEPRAAAAAAITRAGLLHVVGGRGAHGLARTMLILELRSLRWRTVPGPTPREHLAAAALDGVVYAIGGRTAGYDTNLRTFEAFAGGRWSRRPPTRGPWRHRRRALAGRSLGRRRGARGHETVYATPRARGVGRDLLTPRHGLRSLGGRVWRRGRAEGPTVPALSSHWPRELSALRWALAARHRSTPAPSWRGGTVGCRLERGPMPPRTC
jgi:hypothetical protein